MTTEARILRSALSVFSRRGYKNSSIKEIARKAGVNSLTVFRYFHDKETLFLSALESGRGGAFDAAALDARLTFTDPEADLLAMAQAYAEEIRASMAFIRVYIGEAMNFPEIRKAAWFISPVLREHFRAYVLKLEGSAPFARANSALLAEMFVSYLTRRTMSENKSGPDQPPPPDGGATLREAMPAQARCMARILTGK